MEGRRRARLPTNTLEVARSLRRDMTDAERGLWRLIRAGQLGGAKFRRQHPIPPYVVDSCCLDAKLVVELDGSRHTHTSDAARTRFLEGQGYRVLRSWNNEILCRPGSVVAAIFDTVGCRPLTPFPLPAGEGSQERDVP